MQNESDYGAKAQLKEKRLSAGLVSDRFPQLSSMVIHIKHYDEQMAKPLFMDRIINVFPESYAYFDMACLTEECEGTFNLLPVISVMVRDHQTLVKGKIECPGNKKFRTGHAHIKYEIKILYKDNPMSSS